MDNFVVRSIKTNEILDINKCSITYSSDDIYIYDGWEQNPTRVVHDNSKYTLYDPDGNERELCIPDQNNPYHILIDNEEYVIEFIDNEPSNIEEWKQLLRS